MKTTSTQNSINENHSNGFCHTENHSNGLCHTENYSKNINTPEEDSNTKTEKISHLVKNMLEIINPKLDPEIMNETPMRYAKAIMELTNGYKETVSEVIKTGIFESEGYDDMIIVKDIEFNSICEHHLLPFYGKCDIGYYPSDKILGLSKFPRLVKNLSSKFHIQERLSKEIAENIHEVVNAKGVMVAISSIHTCMCFRGVRSVGAKTNTIYKTGNMKEKDNWEMFFRLCEK